MKLVFFMILIGLTALAQANNVGENAESATANYDGTSACSNPQVNDSSGVDSNDQPVNATGTQGSSGTKQ